MNAATGRAKTDDSRGTCAPREPNGSACLGACRATGYGLGTTSRAPSGAHHRRLHRSGVLPGPYGVLRVCVDTNPRAPICLQLSGEGQ